MHSTDTDPLEYHLRNLDGERLAALVADLWAARGYETTLEGGTVYATHDGTTLQIEVGPAPGGDSGSSVPDVVVAPDGGGDTSGDVRVVDAATLAELLSYAVDRSVAQELCEQHLGAPLRELPPPPLARARQRAARIVAGTGSAVLVGVTVAVVIALLVGTPFAGDAQSERDASLEESVVTPVGTTGNDRGERADETFLEEDTEQPPERYPSPPTTSPPGVSREGITDLDALVSAHERAMANRSHTVWFDRHSQQQNVDRRSIQHDIDMVTDGERYLVTTTLVESDDRTRIESLYYDGRNRYKATYNDSAGEYDRVRKLGTRQDPSPTPESVRKSLVWRYLSTENSSVTRQTARGETVIYRVVGTNKTDSRGFDHIWNYTAVALVDARGYVRDLTVEFDARTSSHIYHLRYEITYDGVGETTVDQPGWYETRATNATE